MLNKMKTMCKEWKEVANLLAFVIVIGTAFLLADTMPGLGLGIGVVAVAAAVPAVIEG